MAAVAIVLVGVLGYGLGALTRTTTRAARTVIPPTPQTPAQPSPHSVDADDPARTGRGLAVADHRAAVGRAVDLQRRAHFRRQPGGRHRNPRPLQRHLPERVAPHRRLQVVAADATGDVPLSTEAVLYQNAAATTQAFDELASVAAKCPSTPVRSPSGGTTVATKFDPRPTARGRRTPTVDRLAYSFTSTDQTGTSSKSIAVYLKRGPAARPLLPRSHQHAPIAGQCTIPGIVSVFSQRPAQLPASVVNG